MRFSVCVFSFLVFQTGCSDITQCVLTFESSRKEDEPLKSQLHNKEFVSCYHSAAPLHKGAVPPNCCDCSQSSSLSI